MGRLLGCLRFWLAMWGLIFCPARPWSPGIRRLPELGPQLTVSYLRVGGEKGLPGQLKGI